MVVGYGGQGVAIEVLHCCHDARLFCRVRCGISGSVPRWRSIDEKLSLQVCLLMAREQCPTIQILRNKSLGFEYYKSKIFDSEPGRILSVSQAIYLYHPDRFMSLIRHERCIPFLSLSHGTPTDGPSSVHGELQWPPLGTANGYRAAIDDVIPSP